MPSCSFVPHVRLEGGRGSNSRLHATPVSEPPASLLPTETASKLCGASTDPHTGRLVAQSSIPEGAWFDLAPCRSDIARPPMKRGRWNGGATSALSRPGSLVPGVGGSQASPLTSLSTSHHPTSALLNPQRLHHGRHSFDDIHAHTRSRAESSIMNAPGANGGGRPIGPSSNGPHQQRNACPELQNRNVQSLHASAGCLP